VPDYVASNWYGFAAPKNTPSDIIDKLNKEINAALADPKIKTRLAELGGAPFASRYLPGSMVSFSIAIAMMVESKNAEVVTFAC
jgi:ABC-type amino acid transport substrate-binding protein